MIAAITSETVIAHQMPSISSISGSTITEDAYIA